MSLTVFVKKYSETMHFKPHYNSSTDSYYHTKADYLSDLKSKGLEPYNPNYQHPPRPKYKISRRAKSIINEIKNQSDNCGKFNPSGRLISEMVSIGALTTKSKMSDYCKLPEHYKTTSGGFK